MLSKIKFENQIRIEMSQNYADFNVVDAVESEAGKAIREAMEEGPRDAEREMQQF